MTVNQEKIANIRNKMEKEAGELKKNFLIIEK
jgi:hypothetical protein